MCYLLALCGKLEILLQAPALDTSLRAKDLLNQISMVALKLEPTKDLQVREQLTMCTDLNWLSNILLNLP